MKITLKLFASLTEYLPQQARKHNLIEMDVGTDATVTQIIDAYGLPQKLVHLVLVNGTYIAPEERAKRVLLPDDVLAIWPPIAGG